MWLIIPYPIEHSLYHFQCRNHYCFPSCLRAGWHRLLRPPVWPLLQGFRGAQAASRLRSCRHIHFHHSVGADLCDSHSGARLRECRVGTAHHVSLSPLTFQTNEKGYWYEFKFSSLFFWFIVFNITQKWKEVTMLFSFCSTAAVVNFVTSDLSHDATWMQILEWVHEAQAINSIREVMVCPHRGRVRMTTHLAIG